MQTVVQSQSFASYCFDMILPFFGHIIHGPGNERIHFPLLCHTFEPYHILMTRRAITFVFLLQVFTANISFSQLQVSGFVQDSTSGEKLINAVIQELGTQNTVFSNNFGFFNIHLKSDSARLKFSVSKTWFNFFK